MKKKIIFSFTILIIFFMGCKDPTTIALKLASPSNLVANVNSSSSIVLSWHDNSEDETSFVLSRKTTGDFIQIASLNANTTVYEDISLSVSTEYTYRVKAVNSTENSNWSVPVTSQINIPETESVKISGDVITITGTGFGTKPVAKPLKWETFEDGVLGASVDTTGYWTKKNWTKATFNNDTLRNSNTNQNIKNEQYSPENKSMGRDWFYKNNVGFAETGTAYINMWVYCDYISGDDAWQLKLWRMNSNGNYHGSRPVVANMQWFNSKEPTETNRNSFMIIGDNQVTEKTLYTSHCRKTLVQCLCCLESIYY